MEDHRTQCHRSGEHHRRACPFDRYLLAHDFNFCFGQAQSDSISKQGTEWHNEYIFIFKFTAGPSPKITSYTEYVNSAFVAGFTAQETEKRKAKAKAVL